MTEEYLDDIKIEDLPENFRDVAEVIGLETAIRLVELCGGQNIYCPKLENVAQEARYRKLYEEYRTSRSGRVHTDLARKYNYSESHVRTIIREMRAREIQKPEQAELF